MAKNITLTPTPARTPPTGKTVTIGCGSAQVKKGSGTGEQRLAAGNNTPRTGAVEKNASSQAQAFSGKNGKKATGTGPQKHSTGQDPQPKAAQAEANQKSLQALLPPSTDEPPAEPGHPAQPESVLAPAGPGCQIAIEVYNGANTIVLRYIPFTNNIRAVAMTNDLDDQTVYFNDKVEVRVGPVLQVGFDKYRSIPGDDVVDWIFEKFYIPGEDPWAFHLRNRDGEGGGRNVMHILDFYR